MISWQKHYAWFWFSKVIIFCHTWRINEISLGFGLLIGENKEFNCQHCMDKMNNWEKQQRYQWKNEKSCCINRCPPVNCSQNTDVTSKAQLRFCKNKVKTDVKSHQNVSWLSPKQKAEVKVWSYALAEAPDSGIQSCNCSASRGQTVSRK